MIAVGPRRQPVADRVRTRRRGADHHAAGDRGRDRHGQGRQRDRPLGRHRHACAADDGERRVRADDGLRVDDGRARLQLSVQRAGRPELVDHGAETRGRSTTCASSRPMGQGPCAVRTSSSPLRPGPTVQGGTPLAKSPSTGAAPSILKGPLKAPTLGGSPKAPPAAKLVGAATVRVVAGRAPMTVSCPATAVGGCHGTIVLRAAPTTRPVVAKKRKTSGSRVALCPRLPPARPGEVRRQGRQAATGVGQAVGRGPRRAGPRSARQGPSDGDDGDRWPVDDGDTDRHAALAVAEHAGTLRVWSRRTQEIS